MQLTIAGADGKLGPSPSPVREPPLADSAEANGGLSIFWDMRDEIPRVTYHGQREPRGSPRQVRHLVTHSIQDSNATGLTQLVSSVQREIAAGEAVRNEKMGGRRDAGVGKRRVQVSE